MLSLQVLGVKTFEMKKRKRPFIPVVAAFFLLLEGVNALASHRTMSQRQLSIRRQQQHPVTSLPLFYAIDSTRLGTNNLHSSVQQNMTFPLILSDDEMMPSIQSPQAQAMTTKWALLTRLWQKMKNAVKIDRQAIAKMGVDFGLTYNMISNINGSITLSTAWYIASMKTGLSPLAPGQWRSLLAAYASLYVVAALMRPIRIGVAIGATHKMEHLLQYMQKRIGCTRTNAIGMVFAFGIVLWITCCFAGVTLASALAGVPLWKYS